MKQSRDDQFTYILIVIVVVTALCIGLLLGAWLYPDPANG
jgi:hypothetical protein